MFQTPVISVHLGDASRAWALRKGVVAPTRPASSGLYDFSLDWGRHPMAGFLIPRHVALSFLES
jgi:hypothetical protein